MDKRALLKSVFVFAADDETLLAQLADRMKKIRAAAGQMIFRGDERADSFFIIDTGEITIARQLGTVREKTLSVLGPGNVFGEMAFFSDSPRTADAAAKTDVVLWRIDRTDFVSLISAQPAAGLRIISGLMQVTMARLEQTSRELATVYQTGKIISSGKPLAEIARGVRDEVLLALPETNDAAVFLYNEFNREYDPAAAPQGMREIAETSALARQLKDGDAGFVANMPGEIDLCRDVLPEGSQSALFSPIRREGKLLGFMIFWNTARTGVFTTGHALLVAAVTGQLAAAIENIRYQQEERDRRRLNDARQDYCQ